MKQATHTQYLTQVPSCHNSSAFHQDFRRNINTGWSEWQGWQGGYLALYQRVGGIWVKGRVRRGEGGDEIRTAHMNRQRIHQSHGCLKKNGNEKKCGKKQVTHNCMRMSLWSLEIKRRSYHSLETWPLPAQSCSEDNLQLWNGNYWWGLYTDSISTLATIGSKEWMKRYMNIVSSFSLYL